MHRIALVTALLTASSAHASYPEDPRVDFSKRYDADPHLIYDVLGVGGGGYWNGGEHDGIFAITTGFRFRFEAFEAAITTDITVGSPDYFAADAGLLFGAGVDVAPRVRFIALGGPGVRNTRFGATGPAFFGEGTGPHPTVARVTPALMFRAGIEHRLAADHEPFRALLGLWLFSNVDLVGRRSFTGTDTECFLFSPPDEPCPTASFTHDIGGGVDLGVYFTFSIDFTL